MKRRLVFRMVLPNGYCEAYEAYRRHNPPICVALYGKIYPVGIGHAVVSVVSTESRTPWRSRYGVSTESELTRWCRLTGMRDWPKIANEVTV